MGSYELIEHTADMGVVGEGEQTLAELIAHPLMEGLGGLDRRHLGPGVGGHADGCGEHANGHCL